MPEPLTCYACGETAATPAAPRCDCGEPRWYETDASDFDWPTDLDAGTWAAAELLPADPPDSGVGTASGGTPLVRTPTLDEYVGATVSVKDEGLNPTGSFKDRGTAVGIEVARDAGDDAVGTVSHGNMAMSTAAGAAAAGLDCVVCVPADISAERLENIARYDPRILRVDGDYGQLYYDAIALGPERGVRVINSDTPERVAGQKTTTLEVLVQHRDRAGDVPDAVVMPVSSGGHASGAFKLLRELQAAGLLAAGEVPRLYLVQAEACAPIARAHKRGLDEVERVEAGETVAYSIANPDPPSGTRALHGARETGGSVVAVGDEAILTAKRRLAADAGLTVEASSATAVAGARQLVADGEIGSDEDVVCIATGSGFKESASAVDGVDAETVSLEELGEIL